MKARLRTVLTWTVYPAVMALCLAAYYGMVAYGLDPSLSSYLAAIIGGLGMITGLEIVLPYRRDWLPNKSEVTTDVAFMVLVQVLLPYFLALISVVGLAALVQQEYRVQNGLWPHDHPVWAQMLLLMFTADFLRYWLHRLAHEWPYLWRFHAVHHSLQKLYWINVGRFHPIDKALQFLCDVLPFILLGVSQDVLTLYFVIYSIKGFFQHSNVDVRLGWFNFIISGPELHRWHHSRKVAESNTNYGNNVIVWDILFGTYFLPKGRAVGELGLLDRKYPMRFLAQLRAPFANAPGKSS